MYTEIGSFDAKAKLSELLREVQRGQRYTITLRGRPVADLIPSESTVREDKQAAVESACETFAKYVAFPRQIFPTGLRRVAGETCARRIHGARLAVRA